MRHVQIRNLWFILLWYELNISRVASRESRDSRAILSRFLVSKFDRDPGISLYIINWYNLTIFRGFSKRFRRDAIVFGIVGQSYVD